MDPITTAIVAALTAGVTASAGKVGEHLLVDTYTALKTAIKKRFGGDSEVAKAVDALETKPDSAGRKETLKEEIGAAKADQDPEILKAAQALLDQLKARPDGAQIIQQATGNYIAQAGQGSSANVTVNHPKE